MQSLSENNICFLANYTKTYFFDALVKEIIVSTVIAFGVVLVANSLLVPRYGLHGAAFATLISIVTMVLIKSWIAMKWRFK